MRPHPKLARTDPTAPRAWATDDRSGFVVNHCDMQFQYEWRGAQLVNTRILCHPRYIDEPQRQLGTIFIPPDPLPVFNARPENYTIDEQTWRTTQSGQIRYQQDGQPRIESNLQATLALVSGNGAQLVSDDGKLILVAD